MGGYDSAGVDGTICQPKPEFLAIQTTAVPKHANLPMLKMSLASITLLATDTSISSTYPKGEGSLSTGATLNRYLPMLNYRIRAR